MIKRYPEYKDSGTEWIGMVPSTWACKRLKYLARLINEKGISEGEKPPVDLENIENWTGRLTLEKIVARQPSAEEMKKFKDGDVLFNKLRPYLAKVYQANSNGVCGSELLVLRPQREDMQTGFLFYRLLSKEFINIVDGSTYGTKMPRASWDFIGNQKIVFPKTQEQERIASFLDNKTSQIDELIAKKARMIELLQEERTAIIYQAVTKGLNPNGEMKNSGIDWLGKIPKQWEAKKIQYLGRFQNGISESAEYFGSGYPFISYGDIYNNMALPTQVEGMAQSSDEERGRMSVEEGDVFFTRTSETIEEIGISAVCMQSIKDAVFSGFLIRFRPTTKVLTKEFSKYYFRSEITRKYFIKETNIVTRASLAQDLLKKLPVLLPPILEQKVICEYLERKCKQIDGQMTCEGKAIALLKEYRASLISAVVTGKIDVRK